MPKKKSRAIITSMDFMGAFPPNKSKRFFFIRHNFEYVDQLRNRDKGFSRLVVNRKPMDSQSRDPYVLKEQMIDSGIARREVPRFLYSAVAEGRFEKVLEEMSKNGAIEYSAPVKEVEIAKELPPDLEENKPEVQPDLFSPEEMRRTRRPFGHWQSWYGRKTMKREGIDESHERINEVIEAWEWEDDMTPEQFATALRESGLDPKYIDLGNIGKYIVADETVYDVDYHDTGKSVSDFIWGLSDFELMEYAEEQGIFSDAWDKIGVEDVVYHCTDSKNIPSILENGIDPRNETRGISNSRTGAAVFMSYDPHSVEFYGDACFEIHIGGMKQVGVTPELQQEDPIVECKLRNAIAHKMGDESGDWGVCELSGEGIEENTLVMYGKIPPEFLRLYSAPDEIMEQYSSDKGPVKIATNDLEIEEYALDLRSNYPEFINIRDIESESELDDEDGVGDNLYDILHKVFEWSAKIAIWKASGSPVHERKIENLTKKMEYYADFAIAYIEAKMRDWLDNHFDWNKWWSEMAFTYMSEGKDIRRISEELYTIDIREEINKVARQHILEEVSSFVDEFPEDGVQWLENNLNACAEFLQFVKDDSDVQEWMQEEYNDPEIACDDVYGFIYECSLENAVIEFVNNHEEEYEQFIRKYVFDNEMLDFDDLKEQFSVYEWGEIVEEAAKRANAYQQWKEIFPGLEKIEKGIQMAVSMLDNADTPDQKVAALSYALNVEHYFGNFLQDRIEDESLMERETEELKRLISEIESITPLDYEELESLSNIEVIASVNEIDKTSQTWYKGQVFVENGETYDIDKLTELVSKNHVFKVPIQDLQRQLFDGEAWGRDGKHLSPMDILNDPTKNKEYVEHMQDIRTAPIQKPIIIRKSDMMIVDGYHRLARAFLEGRPWIKAVFAEQEQMRDAIIA